MGTKKQKTVLVTGTSSGLGRVMSEQLARIGHRVFAGMRDSDGHNSASKQSLEEFAEHAGLDIDVLDLDVTREISIAQAVDTVLRETGRIDVLINNAGVMNVGITEAYSVAEIERQMDVNFLGPVRTNRAVLPHMREAGDGLLVHISSLAGRMVFPFFGAYCASKFALEALAESYRYELSGFGVDSIIVEPGPFPTQMIANSPPPQDSGRLPQYGDLAEQPGNILAAFSQFLSSEDAPAPALVSDAIARLIEMPRGVRPTRTVVGPSYGVDKLNEVVRPFQKELLGELGLSHLDPTEA